MKILVTGSAGFIGQHLAKELRDSGHEVHGVDLHGKEFYCDCLDRRQVAATLDALKPEVVVHLAAKVGRLFGEDDIQQTISDNAWMTANIAKACGDRDIRLAYASTSEVYGDWGYQLCSEDAPFTRVPHNIYGLSKRWGEEAGRLYAPDGLTVFRFSMPYGPGLPAGRGRAALINFLYNALHGLPIQVHKGAERSWCWIGDTVRGARLVLERTSGGAFNIGRDDNAIPMRTVAEMGCELVSAPVSLIEDIDPPARQTVVKRLSTAKIRDLGWEPHVEFEEGLARTLEWVKQLPAPLRHPADKRVRLAA